MIGKTISYYGILNKFGAGVAHSCRITSKPEVGAIASGNHETASRLQ
jgi:hypothetical protein